ncbi:hypothetical protein N7E81_19275 [Reichenbachiella carrageenanivorans]|uniref:Uncharacterized protein n=1 Tax=Reichenbachiella carrageenanivorans TaxID=2979869 RepID=A0ABY6D011_9BACT|nr:hypothetical protein [Reichenbachiella carrageenanivorans]UXX79492.1 hypothetical protein N7E81_19275 [Reichenbachiella carrageenanivorans]
MNISYPKQTTELYDNISSSTFQELWGFGELSTFDVQSNSRVKYKDIGLNYQSKYVDFLKELSREYPVINNYYESFVEAGDISPAMISIVTKHQSFELSDVRIRLVIAVHCLTMNDKYERRERIN